MGRFEMLSAVMILFFAAPAHPRPVARNRPGNRADAFFQDIDHSIRELGIGDNSVPKRMKKFAGMFYGRLEAHSKAMDANDVPASPWRLAATFIPEGLTPSTCAALLTGCSSPNRNCRRSPKTRSRPDRQHCRALREETP